MVAVSARPSYLVTDDYPDLDIVRLEQKRRDDLKVKTNTDFRGPRGTAREKAIEKSTTTSEAPPVTCKSESWYEHKIHRRDYRNVIIFARGRQYDDDFAPSPAQFLDQGGDVGLRIYRFKQDRDPRAFPHR